IIGDLNQIGAQSGIPNSVGSKNTLMGYPAVNSKDFARQTIYVKNLASLNKTVGLMGKKIEELENKK
ncbi:MAG: UDP-3-O-(3-hydroxymyristoyl)glucosamine N-acyltransferase, partial [Muribaculaceae bacterium]